MAAPSHTVDGQAHWFEVGQLTSDPGLVRTDFGIPVDCAGAEPGVYCNGSVSVEHNFQLLDLFEHVIGTATWDPSSGIWGIKDVHGDFAGSMFCYNYGTDHIPLWYLTIVTNLWGGAPGQFQPYPLPSLGPLMLFQSITTVIGPAVGYLRQTS
jgi:hypothetical protein